MSPKDPIAHDVPVSLGVFGVLRSIHFDGDSPRIADEVEIVAFERRLTADVKAAVAQALEPAPEQDLRLTHGAPELAGADDGRAHAEIMFGICSFDNPDALSLDGASPP